MSHLSMAANAMDKKNFHNKIPNVEKILNPGEDDRLWVSYQHIIIVEMSAAFFGAFH